MAVEDVEDPVWVFILSWERPHYLWACLDSLYRNTRHPHRFVIADNASADPRVRSVIEGFERRGMFEAVHLCEDNDPNRLSWLLDRYRGELGDYYVYVESDVVVGAHTPCWLERFVRLMDADPSLGTLGSLIDGSDFVEPEVARALHPDLDDAAIDELCKAHSPERSLAASYAEPIIDPFNPPGRLTIMRTATLAVPMARDSVWYRNLRAAGWTAGIATSVVHRHLSLLNVFDHDDYDVRARAAFHGATGRPRGAPARRATSGAQSADGARRNAGK